MVQDNEYVRNEEGEEDDNEQYLGGWIQCFN